MFSLTLGSFQNSFAGVTGPIQMQRVVRPLCEMLLLSISAALIVTLGGCSGSSSPAQKQTQNPIGPNLTLMSSDTFAVGPGQHATEVEPHMVANGSTLVATFQVGRMPPPGGGATDIGWATSTDGGATWQHGSLPGLTTGEGTGIFDAASDPVVAYDAKHSLWMIASLPISNTSSTPAVVISRSTDGLNWQNPIAVVPNAVGSDKNWIVCDTWPNSPFYGNCYLEWDNPGDFSFPDIIQMSTSADGGLTWSNPVPTGDATSAQGIGGQPLVQPNGTVVVPIETFGTNTYMGAFHSGDGGNTWSATSVITDLIQSHVEAAGLRSGPLPSAAVDGAGTIWVVWEDCRFRSGCLTNDLVYSTSADGVNWGTVTRVPIDDTSSTVDHFIPGIGIDPATSGAGAHVGIHFYSYSQSLCTTQTCQLNVGFISSANGGTTWNTPVAVAGPMQLTWLPQSQNGLMVGDYIATVFSNGVPHGVFAVATAPSGTTFNEGMYTGTGLSASAAGRQISSAKDRPLHRLSEPIEQEQPEKRVRPPVRRQMRRSAK